jgi:hypothetical protein
VLDGDAPASAKPSAANELERMRGQKRGKRRRGWGKLMKGIANQMLFFSTSTLFSAPLLPKSACQPPASSLSISLSLSRNHLLRFQTLTFITTDISSISGERKNGGGVFVVSLVLLSCFLLLSFSLPFLFPLSPPNSPQPEEAA